MDNYGNGIIENRWFEKSLWYSDRNVKIEKTGINPNFFVRGQNLTFFYYHNECSVEIWAKKSLNPWLWAYSIFKGFEILILEQRAIPKWP